MKQYLPQIIYMTLSLTSLLVAINNHGKERKPENAWGTVVAMLIVWPLLYWGGFFK